MKEPTNIEKLNELWRRRDAAGSSSRSKTLLARIRKLEKRVKELEERPLYGANGPCN